MSDRTYTSFAIPLSVLADPAKTDAIRVVFGLSRRDFDAAILAPPESTAYAGLDALAVRLVDGRPCLVFEKSDCSFGGTAIEDDLMAARIPFIQRNAAGCEYGPTSTVFTGSATEVVRLDHDLEPVVGIVERDGKAVVDPEEVAEFLHYARLRQAVLLYPGEIARAG
jgi:hypothetical protein